MLNKYLLSFAYKLVIKKAIEYFLNIIFMLKKITQKGLNII